MNIYPEIMTSGRIIRPNESNKDRKRHLLEQSTIEISEFTDESIIDGHVSNDSYIDRRCGDDRRDRSNKRVKRLDLRNRNDRRKYSAISLQV